MTVGIGLCSAPARSLTAEDTEFAEDFLFADLVAVFLDAVSLDESFAGAKLRAAGLGLLLFFFAGAGGSVVSAFRFLSARAFASPSHAAFTFPRDAGRLLFHSAESSSPPICAMVRSVRMDGSDLSMRNEESRGGKEG